MNGQMQGTACEVIGVRAAAGAHGEEGTAVQRPVSPSHQVRWQAHLGQDAGFGGALADLVIERGEPGEADRGEIEVDRWGLATQVVQAGECLDGLVQAVVATKDEAAFTGGQELEVVGREAACYLGSPGGRPSVDGPVILAASSISCASCPAMTGWRWAVPAG